MVYQSSFFQKASSVSTDHQLRQSSLNASGYRFIDPLLGCGHGVATEIAEFASLKEELRTITEAAKKAGTLDDVSVYFDTRDGRTLGIGTDQKYSPGSLMKVLTMIAVLKTAEKDDTFLQQKIVYTGNVDENAVQFFKPAQTLTPHQSYTVEELTERMIAYSDNNALALLLSNVDRSVLLRVYADLGISIPDVENSVVPDYMTIQKYAILFRILHNATYLNRDMSEKAMEILVKSSFPPGIEAGVPDGVPVAQKFGEYYAGAFAGAAHLRELHDCGIVYARKHAYLLCIFTKGTDYARSANVMATISSHVYDFVDTKL